MPDRWGDTGRVVDHTPTSSCYRAVPKRSTPASPPGHPSPPDSSRSPATVSLSPTRVENSVPCSTRAAGVMAAVAVCLFHGRGERALALPACRAARDYRPPWPSGDGGGARRCVRTACSSSNRFASVGGSTEISVSRLTRSAARARI